jgi:hypothetical protein
MFRGRNLEYWKPNFTSVGDSAMSKHPQHRFPRLAIVGPTDKKPHKQFAVLPWWGPRRSADFSLNQASQVTHGTRMAVMPTLSRSVWFRAMAWIWNFLREYFVDSTSQQRGAVVLSFRRHATRARSLRVALAEESFVSKKSNGSVRWNSDREVAPQEGGRG